MIQEVGAGGARGGGWQRRASWGPDLLLFFLSSGVRWWLASSDPSPTSSSFLQELEARGVARENLQASGDPPPLPFSYLVFFFVGDGGARAGGDGRGDVRHELFFRESNRRRVFVLVSDYNVI
jgi:hypothetical protein